MKNEAIKSWELINRKSLVTSPFLKVFEDTVRLPNGKIIDDYTVVKKPDIVMIVATTPDDKILTFREYKYAADAMLNTLPAGHMKAGESAVEAATRELLEETGYTSEEVIDVGALYEYPTKDLHVVRVVYAKNITLKKGVSLEETEIISDQRFLNREELVKEIREGKWIISSVLGAMLVSGYLLPFKDR